MKITYEFVNEKIEVEVDEEFGKLVMRMNLTDESKKRTLRNHETHLDTQNDYSIWCGVEYSDDEEIRDKEIREAVDQLSDKQKELIDVLYGPQKISSKEYAKREGVTPGAITFRKKTIRRKLKKLL